MRHVAITRTQQTTPISIHAPRVGCDASWICAPAGHIPFQSTHPGWGATDGCISSDYAKIYFNPRTPGGVRRKYISFALILYPISIHAPRVGCDCCDLRKNKEYTYFNPRTPGGVRLNIVLKVSECMDFNPRTPGGVRLPPLPDKYKPYDFNPRTPGGVRPVRAFN